MKASLLFMAFHDFPRTKMKQIIFDGTYGVTRLRPIKNLIRYLEVEKCPPVHKICRVIGNYENITNITSLNLAGFLL